MHSVDLDRRIGLACHHEKLSRREAARRFGVDRKTVSKMLEHSAPPGYRRRRPPKRPKLDPFTDIIDRILEEDRTVHREQRHTAKRIFERLRDEHGFAAGQTIVKDYVRERCRRLREIFVPLVVLQYEKGVRFVLGGSELFNFEAFPHAGATLGNAYAYGAVGATLRVGSHLRKDSGAPGTRMIMSGTNFPTPGDYLVWNLFSGIEWRAAGYNILVDGNTFNDTSAVSSKPWVYDVQLGAELGFGAYRLSVMNVYRSKEFFEQEQGGIFLRAAFSAPL